MQYIMNVSATSSQQAAERANNLVGQVMTMAKKADEASSYKQPVLRDVYFPNGLMTESSHGRWYISVVFDIRNERYLEFSNLLNQRFGGMQTTKLTDPLPGSNHSWKVGDVKIFQEGCEIQYWRRER